MNNALDILAADTGDHLWRLLNVPHRYREDTGDAVDDDRNVHLVDAYDQEAVQQLFTLIQFSFAKVKSSVEIDDGDDFAPQVEDAFDVAR